jgi:hypothetical protein
MALINDFSLAGEGIITSLNKSNRSYRVGEQGAFSEYKEAITTESREWVGLTYSAALSKVERNEQPGDPNATNTWTFREDNRIVGSYIVERVYERKAVISSTGEEVPRMVQPGLTIPGRSPVDIGHYLDHPSGGSVIVYLTKRNAGSTMYFKESLGESDTKNASTAGKNAISWAIFNSKPLSVVTSTSPITLFDLKLYSGNFSSSIFTGPTRNNTGFREIWRVYAREEIVLSGIYTTEVDRIFYSENRPF